MFVFCSNACKLKSLQRSSSQGFNYGKVSKPFLKFCFSAKIKREKCYRKSYKFPFFPPPYLGTDSGLYAEILLWFPVLYLRFFRLWYTMKSLPHWHSVSSKYLLWREGRAICVDMKNLVCHSANPHGKIKKLWENNGMVHFIAPFTLPAGVSSSCCHSLCHLYMSHSISAWFSKTGGRSSSRVISLSFTQVEVNNIWIKWVTFQWIERKASEHCVYLYLGLLELCENQVLWHDGCFTHKHTLHLSCLFFPFLKTQVCVHTAWDPDYEARRNIARCPPPHVLEYILRYFSRRMKHWW